MSAGLSAEQLKLRRRKKGIRLCLLVSESNSCRSAYRFLKAFLMPSLDELHLVTAVTSEKGRASALARQREVLEVEVMDCAQYHVVVKEEDYTLFESLGRYITTTVRPHIIFMASTNLCTSSAPGTNGSMSSRIVVPTARGGPGPGGSTSAGQQMLRRTPTMSRNGAPATSSGSSPAPMSASTTLSSTVSLGTLGSSCLALRLLPELRCAPVLLAKYNSKGPWLAATASSSSTATQLTPAITSTLFPQSRPPSAAISRSSSMRPSASGGGSLSSGGGSVMSSSSSLSSSSMGWPMRVMIDLQPNSRHVLEWLFEQFTPGHDHLFLTVSQAFDGQHNVKPSAQRLLTAFGVQAAVNSFEADKSVLAGPVNKSLPQAVMESEPDVLVLQTPRCRGVPSNIVELLYTAKTSFLIWPPDYTPSA
ncbi:hypothetical protein VaNZ11_006899 [Volvox africanus]|uniref:Uncharacterized protein n=1 Tax=Volvox africanus TaxID=51714 RepID=A0ABQ5S2T9_9CHLO|nr:hypothetical protein VaNZ11_006899 [Volvox africanus]